MSDLANYVPPVPLASRKCRNPDQEVRRLVARALVREWVARRAGEPPAPKDLATLAEAGRDRVDEVLRALRREHGDRRLSSDPAVHLNGAIANAARVMKMEVP